MALDYPEVNRERTDEGVRIWRETCYGGVEACTSTLIEWGAHEEIKQCPGCEEFHNAHDPGLCHSCAFGLG